MPALPPNSVAEHSKKRVAYYYDANVGNFYFGAGHPMKPHRVRLTHHLILNYGVYRRLEVFRPHPATYEDMTRFHRDEYIDFLECVSPDNLHHYSDQKSKHRVGRDADCPVFKGLYDFCQLSSGGSIAAAVKLNKQKTGIAINWMGGLHHAKKSQASGFCYANDIVLGILELLKFHTRVLYVDIDVHHGDGVEEAFATSDRVMTVSFHKYGANAQGDFFFPGTGAITDVGVEGGHYYAVNVPLQDGITDDSYASIFVPVMKQVMEKFDPSAVVLQCGADSLSGDRLGPFNLTLKGHGACVEFFLKFNVPLMLLGGGGYTPRNVARCWAYETGLAVGMELAKDLPYNDYFEHFAPDYRLHIEPSKMVNKNDEAFLEKLQTEIFENLRHIPAVPSVQMQPTTTDAIVTDDTLALDTADPDERLPTPVTDSMVEEAGEMYDCEKEGGDLRNEHSAKPKRPADNGKKDCVDPMPKQRKFGSRN